MSVIAMDKAKSKGKGKDEPEEEEAKGGKMKLIIIAVVVLALAGGGAYMMLGKKGSSAPPPDVAGVVLKLDSIQVNLAGQHYLSIDVALQMTTKADPAVDGSKAQDAIIAEFSGKPITQVNDPASLAKLKAQLLAKIRTLYDKTVMGLYFTEFVTQ